MYVKYEMQEGGTFSLVVARKRPRLPRRFSSFLGNERLGQLAVNKFLLAESEADLREGTQARGLRRMWSDWGMGEGLRKASAAIESGGVGRSSRRI